MLTQRKKRTWAVLPLAGALLLLLLVRITDISFIEDVAIKVMSPFTGLTLTASDGIAGTFRAFSDLKNMSAENSVLREENQALAGERAARSDLEKENEALRRQIGVEQKIPYTLVGARVAYFDPLSFSYSAVIDAGARNGVREGMPVVMAGNIVFGKITEVHEGFSRVMLVSDVGNKVSVKTGSERASGVLSGAQGSALLMDLVEKSAEMNEGELVVTSGLDGVYPRGLAVGWVKEVIASQEGIFKQAAVRPAFESGFASTVFVITDYLQ